MLHRKIWPPSVAPLFCVLALIGWWHRERRWGAFTWGLVGVLTGQLHLAGLFLMAGFVLWAALFDRHRMRWLAWLGGAVLGAVPLLPWLATMGRELGTGAVRPLGWVRLVEMKFWLNWLSEPFGLSVGNLLGEDFVDFLGYPLVAGWPTFLVALLHGIVLAVGVRLLRRAGNRLWQRRAHWRALLIGRESATAFTQNAALVSFGLLLTAALLPIHSHYLATAFPLTFVWLARLALGRPQEADAAKGRRLLGGLCVAQLLLSACLLGYLHGNPRFIRGDYGMPFGAQRRAGLFPPRVHTRQHLPALTSWETARP
jgi:hypothetical protein